MNFKKYQIGILLPCLAIVGALFLNVANAHLLLLIWVLFALWQGQGNDSLVAMRALAMLLLAVWLTLAQFWSGVSSIGWYTTWTFLALPLAYLGWQFHSRIYLRAWPLMRNFLGLLGSLLAVWGILQVTVSGYTRAVGPLSDPNTYGCLLNLLWFPLFTRFLSLTNGESAVKPIGFALLVILTALMMSGSRTALLIWMLLFAIIALLQWKTVARARLLFVCAMAAATFFIYSLYSSHLTVASYQAAIVLPHAAQAAASPRFLMWQSTLKMWLDAPWLGGGLGSWNYIYPAYRSAGETGTAGYYAHNDYLQLLQEGGIALFVILIGIFGWLYLGSIKRLAASSAPERIENIGIVAGITAVVLHAAVNFSFYLIYINILVGIYLACLTPAPSLPLRQSTENSPRPLTRIFSVMVLMVIAVNGFNALLSSISLSLLRGESSGWQIVHAFAPGYSPISLATLLASIRPSDTNAQRYITASMENEIINNPAITAQQAREVFGEIIDGYELMRNQNKYDAAIPANEAGFLIGFGKRYDSDSNQLFRARELLQESLRKDPARVDSAILLGETYLLQGQVQAAYNILNDMIPKAWHLRDQMIIEAEILKLKNPQYATGLSDLQQELRGMRINCGTWECGKRYAQIEKSARETLDNMEKGKQAN
ncbi:MAG: O-antigen ligase family protein [Gallionellaceae bacterium]